MSTPEDRHAITLYDSHGSPCVIGPYDRLRPREAVLADARRSTDDPAHLEWVRRVYDHEVVSATEAQHLESPLVQRPDRLEAAPPGHDWLVGRQYSIPDLSVRPRVQVIPWAT